MKFIVTAAIALLCATPASAVTMTLVPFGQNQTRTETQAGATSIGQETNALNFLNPYADAIAAFGNIGTTSVDWDATSGFYHSFNLTRTTSAAGNRVSSTGKGEFTADQAFCFVITGSLDVTNTNPGTTFISANIGTPGNRTAFYDETVGETDVTDASVSLPSQSVCVAGGPGNVYVFDFEMTNTGGDQIGNATGSGDLDIQVVPEPAHSLMVMSGAGVLCFCAATRRRP